MDAAFRSRSSRPPTTSPAKGCGRPDLTLILDVEPATAAARLRGREAATHTTADRIERAGDGFHARMRAECRAPEVKTVFSAWGSYGWLDQHRRFGTRVFSPDEIAAIEDRLSRLAP